MEETSSDDLPGVRRMLLNQGLSSETVNLIMQSWRGGTKAQYRPHLKKWFQYCIDKNLDPHEPGTANALQYLTGIFHEGSSYSVINTTISAMSIVIKHEGNLSFGKLPLVKRLLKGVYELRPVFPKYTFIWDVKTVFEYFRSLPEPDKLNLKTLSQKLAMLLSLLSGGQRCQTIHSINIVDMIVTENSIIIPIMSKLKQSKPGQHMSPMQFKGYPNEKKLCVVTHLSVYLERTKHLRKSPLLFIATIKPHNPVSRDTISRWCKEVLKNSGINTNIFSSHSSRSAASSNAKLKGVEMKTIISNAGWKNERTFAKHYDKIVLSEETVEKLC